MKYNTFLRMLIFIVGLVITAAVGTVAGRWLASSPDQAHMFRSTGAVIAVCLYTWLYFKLFGPIGPYRPPRDR